MVLCSRKAIGADQKMKLEKIKGKIKDFGQMIEKENFLDQLNAAKKILFLTTAGVEPAIF
jgi:hypothetical protein